MKLVKKVLVTGANGQLGRCLLDIASNYDNYEMTFVGKDEFNIEDGAQIDEFLQEKAFDYCVNTAAYTNVERAESEKEEAFGTNAEGARLVAKACEKYEIPLIHISTDYVFDGTKKTPYTEEDPVSPLNVYGASKLKGEAYIIENTTRYFILRTSWLYSQYGHNFMNTILKYASEGKPLTVTTEQTGTPTNANDLAKAIMTVIGSGSDSYGVYHFSNEGEATWYDFAKAILEYSGQIKATSLAQTGHYRTFAKRPQYSVLNKNKFKETFNTEVTHWTDSLESLIQRTNN